MSMPIATGSAHDKAPVTLPFKSPMRGPDSLGRYGSFGGRFVPETLMEALNQLAEAYEQAKADPEFRERLGDYLKHYVGRPSPLFHTERLTKTTGGAEIYLKREDLNHTGAHKINNAIGQVMLAQRMGKTRVIAETGAGQHGVATATACALFGLECTVYMGEEDIRRQKLNVFNMRTLGAKVVPVATGSRTLRDATNEAMRDWMGSSKADALHDRQRGRAASVPDDRPRLPGRDRRRDAAQCLERIGRLPDAVVACVGGGSNAAGMFEPFIEDAGVELIGAEAGGRGPEGRRARRQLDPGASRGPARQLQLCPPGRRRPDPGRPLDLGRARLSRASAPSIATGKTSAGSATRASPTPRHSTPTTAARREGSCRRSNPATPWPSPSRKPVGSGPGKSSSCASPAAATRMLMNRPAPRGADLSVARVFPRIGADRAPHSAAAVRPSP